MPSIKDVAKEAGVSTATVSYVLNESGAVGEATRQRVLKAVKKLGYRPSITARNLQARESRMMGYSWRPRPPDQFSPVLEKFLHSMAEAAARHDYHVLTFPCPQTDEVEAYRKVVEMGRVDGFIVSDTNTDDPRIKYLLDAKFPFVAFGRANPSWDFPWVDVDGADGVRQAVQHLAGLGHQRIACLTWPKDSLTGQHRLEGYRQGMAQAGLKVKPSWVLQSENDCHKAYQVAQSWLAQPSKQRPSAVVTVSDVMAMGVLNAIADAGLQAGRDIAVIGFDDLPLTCYVRPTLTSLRQPISEVGELVVSMLINLVNGKQPQPAQVLLKPRLIVRDSTKP